MTPDDVSPLISVLTQSAKHFKFAFDADIAKCLLIFNSEISALVNNQDFHGGPSEPESNINAHFCKAKLKSYTNMKELWEEMVQKWMNILTEMKSEFLGDTKTFLIHTKLEVKPPAFQVISCSDANLPSSCVVSNYGSGRSINRMQESQAKQSSAETSISEPFCHIKTENIQPQQLNFSKPEMTCTQFLQEISSTTCQSITPFIKPECNLYSPFIAPNEPAQILNPSLVNQSVTHPISNSSNRKVLSVVPENSSLAIKPKIKSPKKKLTCPDCKRIFYHKSSLERHLPRHTKEKIHICQFCYKKFAHQGAKDNHEKKHCKVRKDRALTEKMS